jgi:hypothetical protein
MGVKLKRFFARTLGCCLLLILYVIPLQKVTSDAAGKIYRGEEEVIGRTVLDRKISLYKFGTSGMPAILWIGGLHGDELLTVELLREFINYLENTPDAIPNNLQVWIIPVLNVDGYVIASRHNANAVDLNRNFNTKDWQPKTFTNLTEYPTGGGQTPLSEPETQSLVSFITANRSQLLTVINIHCCGGVVVGSRQDKLTEKLEKIFLRFAKFRTLDQPWNQAAYPVTGSLSAWLWEEHQLADLFLELEENDKQPFQSLNKAMLALVENFNSDLQVR